MNRLKELRIKEHITQGELAKQLGLSKSAISMYETDKRQPSLQTWLRLAKQLDVTPQYLVGWPEDPTKHEEADEKAKHRCLYHHVHQKRHDVPIIVIYQARRKQWRLQNRSNGKMSKKIVACPFCGAKLYSDGTAEE